ncbi:hypothetical protein [Alkaliphilus peptidifermentans]|uniref:Elp3/MiaA/NifB-like radical SAM core domain-containing protein n=1 Tax=Alkaliphilus peptidifermentans DSM 18978 TaxID=1120976 RepID=A0A1G5I5H4_9FIRM|nr:hypothetical protein [Alkaliphilus peptidifermentans]SCY70940.1 hypothetical protein SAMN03080606_02254 [Alkaliphilus peptidifermentans DSM 18978]
MFIEDIMNSIWEPLSISYWEECKRAEVMKDEELVKAITNKITSQDSFVYKNEWLHMTSLTTSGCPHKVNNGKFCGCSMCNYFSEDMETLAMMSVIKKRNPALYGKTLRFCFENCRGKNSIPNVFEYVNGHDSLSTEEFPEEAFNELFCKENLFTTKPYKLIFEARASSISIDRLKVFKDKCARNVEIAFGVEVYDQWIRNHWLNKNITNSEIIKAVKMIKECKCQSRANLLMGMPGLTEEQSMKLLMDSIAWLKNLGVDYITLSPLVCKEKTLQSIIFEKLKDNSKIIESKIIGAIEDGSPSIFFIFEAIYKIMGDGDLINKVVFAPVNFMQYFVNKGSYYQTKEEKDICSLITNALNEFDIKRDVNLLLKAKEAISKENSYINYLRNKKQQAGEEKMLDTLCLTGEEIARVLWKDSWEGRAKIFRNEAKEYFTGCWKS